MKRFGVALFALVLWLSFGAFSQDASQQQSPDEQKPTAQSSDKSSTADQQAGVQEHAQQGTISQGETGKKAHAKSHLMGKISDDGKTLTDKDGKSWTIENPDAVKGHEGHEVSLRGHVDTANNSINVTSVKMTGEHASKKKGGAMSEQPPQ